jgi:hypothetical protein
MINDQHGNLSCHEDCTNIGVKGNPGRPPRAHHPKWSLVTVLEDATRHTATNSSHAVQIPTANVYRFGDPNNAKPVLRALDWTVRERESWAVIGSGAGEKTAFFEFGHLNRFCDPSLFYVLSLSLHYACPLAYTPGLDHFPRFNFVSTYYNISISIYVDILVCTMVNNPTRVIASNYRHTKASGHTITLKCVITLPLFLSTVLGASQFFTSLTDFSLL